MKLTNISISQDLSQENWDKEKSKYKEKYKGYAVFLGNGGIVTVDLTHQDVIDLQQLLLHKVKAVVD